MKKIIISFSIILIILLSISYILLFTKKGNSFISSYVENKINKSQKDFNFKIDEFSLTTSDMNLKISINSSSNINVFGKLSILSKTLDLEYDINFTDLRIFKNLVSKDIKGIFSTKGIFKGDSNESVIQGTTNIAESQTKYFFKLIDFKLSDLFIDLKDAKVDQLLAIINQPLFVSGNLNLYANIKNLSLDNLDGILNYNLTKGVFNNNVFNKTFGKRMDTRIIFSTEAKGSFLGNTIKLDSQLKSTVADVILSNFIINIQENSSRADYSIDFKNLSRLNGLIEKKLNGQFLTKGKIRQQNEIISFNGFSEYFDGLFSYKFDYSKSNFENILLNLEDGKVEKLLFLLNEPIYATGDLDFDFNLKNFTLYKLGGVSNFKITNAKLINDVINTVFKQNFKNNIIFSVDAKTNYDYNTSTSNIIISSNIADLNITNGLYNFSTNKFTGNYDINIDNLEKIYDITKISMYGNANVKGNFEKNEVILKINGNTQLGNSNTNFNLLNNNLIVDINNISLQKLSNLFAQPQIFDANANINFKYNFFNKIGTLDANLENGILVDGKILNNLKKIIKYDLTKIIFKNVELKSKIDDQKIAANVLMQADNSQIEIKNSLIDYSKDTINANLNIELYKNKLNFIINGNINNPDISFVAEDYLNKNKKKLIRINEKEIDEKLKKFMKNTDKKDMQEAIKKIKSIF